MLFSAPGLSEARCKLLIRQGDGHGGSAREKYRCGIACMLLERQDRIGKDGDRITCCRAGL
jgi:hypothetical protein